MTLEQEIRTWLRRYLRNEIPFEAFEDWLVDSTWDVQREGTPSEQALTYAIERELGEYTSQCKNEAQMKRALRRFAPTWWAIPRVRGVTLSLSFGTLPATTTAMESGAAAVDRPREAVSG